MFQLASFLNIPRARLERLSVAISEKSAISSAETGWSGIANWTGILGLTGLSFISSTASIMWFHQTSVRSILFSCALHRFQHAPLLSQAPACQIASHLASCAFFDNLALMISWTSPCLLITPMAPATSCPLPVSGLHRPRRSSE